MTQSKTPFIVVLSLALTMMLTIGSIGAISPNIQACFLEYFPTSGGTAAALLGAAQFGVAGLLSALSAMLPHTLGAVILSMAVCGSVAYVMLARSIIKGRATAEVP
jgi:DHA1 family bicyclomycin/chloramphenicol resistance-like MFS transporter